MHSRTYRNLGATVIAILIAGASILVSTSRQGYASQPDSVGVGLTGISSADAEHLIKMAQVDPWVRENLATAESQIVQIVDPADGKAGPILWIVDYDGSRAFAIEFDQTQSKIVGRHQEDVSVPDLSPGEHDVASQVALADASVQSRGGGHRLVVNNVTGSSGEACTGRRCVAIFLTREDADYAHLIVAIVDLQLRRVVKILP